MALRRRALGLSLGIVWGSAVLLITWWLMLQGSSGGTITELSKFYFGYTFSWFGGIVGFVWGFVDGFIVGVVIAWLYNYLSSKIYRY